jgi:ribosomal protein L14
MIEEFHQHGELDVADNAGTMVDLTVSKVDENLDCCQESCKDIWSMFVRSKLVVDDEKKRLNENCVQLLRKLFERSFNDSVIQFEKVLIENDGNLVGTFLKNVLKPEEIDDNILRKIIAPKECQTLVSLLF